VDAWSELLVFKEEPPERNGGPLEGPKALTIQRDPEGCVRTLDDDLQAGRLGEFDATPRRRGDDAEAGRGKRLRRLKFEEALPGR
jgi:hypothetical protein